MRPHMRTWHQAAALCLAFTTAGEAAELSAFLARSYDDGAGHTLPYRLFVPADYDASRKYPLILYLHGAGGWGTNNLNQMTDVPRFLVWAEPDLQAQWPCFILAPQCPPGQQWANMPWNEATGAGKFAGVTWPMEASLALLDSLASEYRGIDTARLYVMGISMGGYGTWDAVCRFPNKFAAAIPICGGGDPAKVAAVSDLRNLRVRAYHCADDPVVPVGRSREMIQALKALNGLQPRYTEFPDGGHDAYTRAFSDPTLPKWLFDSTRSELPALDGRNAQQWDVFETSFETTRPYANPFVDLEVTVVFQHRDQQWNVPAFWAGGGTWTVRFAPPAPGQYTYRVACSDTTNPDLNGKERTLTVTAYRGANPLLRHGFIRVSANRRHFEHADGTPFFWLGDTWWKGLSRRLPWEGFQQLTADRKAKGYTVVQIIGGGPFPDEPLFDPRWNNEGGMPYEKDFERLNPAYFDYADRRIRHLVENGLVPAVVGGWGWHTRTISNETIDGGQGKWFYRHWRYLIARYGAYPVVWIVAGEMRHPYLNALAKYVRETDPYRHLKTMHPPGVPELQSGRKALKDETLVDFDFLQTAHNDWASAPITVSQVTLSYSKTPPMPVVNGEVVYEWHKNQGTHEIQRFMFWTCMLNGAAGHTYGAGGVWQMNTETVHGSDAYETIPWHVAMHYPGSAQVGLGRKLLEEYPWWRFEPHPEWVEPRSTTLFEPHAEWYDNHQKWAELDGRWDLPYAAGIPGEVRFIYIPGNSSYRLTAPSVKRLEPEVAYRAFLFDPVWGQRFDLGPVVKSKPKPRPPNNTAALTLLEAHQSPLLFIDSFDPVGDSPWKDYGTDTQRRDGRLVGGQGMLTVLEAIQEYDHFEVSTAPVAPVPVDPSQAVSALADEYHPPQLPSPQDWVLVLERMRP